MTEPEAKALYARLGQAVAHAIQEDPAIAELREKIEAGGCRIEMALQIGIHLIEKKAEEPEVPPQSDEKFMKDLKIRFDD